MDLFIVGAGAHVPYGFPSGTELREVIRNLAFGKINSEVQSFIKKPLIELYINIYNIHKGLLIENLGLEGAKNPRKGVTWLLQRFTRDFIDSLAPTIDSFLEQRKDWEYFGKLVITVVLRFFERRDPLRHLGTNWIGAFLEKYVKTGERDSLIKGFPKVITFNYDRLFEEAIIRRLVSYYSINQIEAEKTVESLPIFHIYGKIGSVCFDKIHEEKPSDWEKVSAEIKIISRSSLLHGIDEKITEYLTFSTRIFILGFGFDQTNSGLIINNYFKENVRDVSIYITAVGLPNRVRKELEVLFKDSCKYGDRLNIFGVRDDFGDPDSMPELNCSDLLEIYL